MDEAPTLEKGLLSESLTGKLSSGESWQAEVFLPHPYSFLMMKLFAFRDWLDDADKEFGRYHALDAAKIFMAWIEFQCDTILFNTTRILPLSASSKACPDS